MRDEEMFKRARITRLFEAAVERIECGIQIVEKYETNESEGEVAAVLWKSLAQFGAVHEARDVIKHCRAEKCLHDFHKERAAIGFRDKQVAVEEEPELAQKSHQARGSAESELCVWPVRRKKASSRLEEEVVRRRATGESRASKRPE